MLRLLTPFFRLPLLLKLAQKQFTPLCLLASDMVLFAEIKEVAKPFQVVSTFAILNVALDAEGLDTACTDEEEEESIVIPLLFLIYVLLKNGYSLR